MRKSLGLCTAIVLALALVAGSAQAGKASSKVTNITLATYVWQPTTVAAMNNIVSSFNKTHPKIHVSIVPVDVNSVHDKLLTSFVGGTSADVVHDEAADIAGFTQQGYLANLTPLIPKSLKNEIPKSVWDVTNFGHKITGVPIMLQTYNVFANMSILKSAGIKAPTVKSPWTWAQFQSAAKKLTTNGNYGVCWGLRSPTATIQTLSLNWGAQWNYLQKGRWVLNVGQPEQTILQIMHNMIYGAKTVDPAGVGLSGSAVLPAFFAGKCAMTVQGNYNAQGMIEQAPKGFNWAMFPPLKGKTQDQAADPQTLSISAQSQHKAEAMTFIAYALNAQNMAKLSAGDWLIPAAPSAAKIVVRSTKHYGSWKNAVSAVPHFKKANWVTLGPYARWKAEVATPLFRQYLANQIDLPTLSQKLTDGWNQIRG
ncbi:MAG TPA: sugar ABC transporter substrate-binding protein [Gaiellaceae bacterium]